MRTFNVLFLCTGNSARSILGEAIVTRLGGVVSTPGLQRQQSPKGAVHPLAIDLLKRDDSPDGKPAVEELGRVRDRRCADNGFHLHRFATTRPEDLPDLARPADDNALGMPDPAAAQGSEMEHRSAFRQTYAALENRIKLFLALPLESLDSMSLQNRLDAIGRKPPGTAAA